ncbi:MAG: hypothetical protein IJ916_02705 [Paludibacteraceae bacterium]|nr:hypothetical protein [Paludibacteraceae bacterium]
MITKRLILILLLLIPSLMSYSKQGSDRILRLQVNVFGRDWTFPQDTVTQKIILEFIEEAQLAEDEFFEVRARGKKEYSIRLSQEKTNWLRQWILENVSVPIKIVAVGIADHEPLVENPQTDYERDLNMFVDIRVVRE